MTMQNTLSPAKATLLAVHFAAAADIERLHQHVASHASVIRPELLLRILLTHLPETVDPSRYTNLLCEIRDARLSAPRTDKVSEVNHDPVEILSEEQARKKARKLRLLDLAYPGAPTEGHDDPLTLFLFHRAYRIDEDAGMLMLVPELLHPFVDHCDAIRTWLVSTILPLSRRNFDYHPNTSDSLSISAFEKLADSSAVDYLLAPITEDDVGEGELGRDLRGVLGPWFHHPARWPAHGDVTEGAGWAHFMQWLVGQAARSWKLAVQAVEEYNGPGDVDLGPVTATHPQDTKFDLLLQSYLRAAIASVYSMTEASNEGLLGAWQILSRVCALTDTSQPGDIEAEAFSNIELVGAGMITESGTQLASHLRGDLLDADNSISCPTEASIVLLKGTVISAFLLTRLGQPFTVRSTCALVLLQDQQEQKGELQRVIRLVANNAPRSDDDYWAKARRQILWLHDWGRGSSQQGPGKGPFGMISTREIEMEILKAMLADSRFDLAGSIYEAGTDFPLAPEQIEEVVLSAAFNAFDNASNPNRTRGGLKKCDSITLAFPRMVPRDSPSITRMRALLTATHGLSSYRLVLKQGEPFTPVVLRVHSDPISIIEKVLEQNHSAYTRVTEFVEISKNLAIAGLLTGSKKSMQFEDIKLQEKATANAERRIVAMCIEAALREDDFETAYSYVMSRLGGPSSTDSKPSTRQPADEWSWSAALKAGQYIRTQRSLQPTHLGTSSGNPEIRHLEQRLECLATALRIAPASQLLEILKTFRRCEEQLDSAIAEEAAKEDAWDAVGDFRSAPGSFDQPDPDRAYPPRNITASASARQAEEAPMSLFDLSRATARLASKNFTSLSGLQAGENSSQQGPEAQLGALDQSRVRKRDQLRDAATGTLVSGVGWLIGANVNRPAESDEARD